MATIQQQRANEENVPLPKNNVVPNSELQSAVNAMKEHMDDCMMKETRLEPDSRAVLVHLLEQAGTSVASDLLRLVEPVSDLDYHSLIRQSSGEDDGQVDSCEESEDIEESEDSEDDFNEEELMDQEALQRARDLRQQVRDAAERVNVLRSNVTDRAVASGQREFDLLVGPAGRDRETPMELDALVKTFDESYQGDRNKYLDEMEGSLQRLSVSLKAMDVEMPDKIENLQKTVEVIQEALKQGASLSQTEQAIRSRENECPIVQETADPNAPPEKRLASFLGQY